MSAPDTTLERETRRHLPALAGIALAVFVGLTMGAAVTFTAIERAGGNEAGLATVAPDVGASVVE